MTNPTPPLAVEKTAPGAPPPAVVADRNTVPLATTPLTPGASMTHTQQPMPGLTQNIIIMNKPTGPGLVVRAVWYLFIGWWLTGIAISIAWLASLTVVLLPITFILINSIPMLLTLRPRRLETAATVDADGTIRITTAGAEQRAFWIRALWFVFVGWWATGAAMLVAYALSLTIIGLPVGLMLFNRLPAVMTLQRN